MRAAHELEAAVGMQYYASETAGVGGRLRDNPEDFVVQELSDLALEPLSTDPARYEHLVIEVTLTDWDTNDFAHELANQLGISRERIAWAGTKDKRAVTTQFFSIPNVSADALPDVSNCKINPVGRFGRPLQFGDLRGNRFEIVVRDPERPGNADAITQELRAFGGGELAVPNYFGQQRFGSHRPVTHTVGLAIVRRDWEQAVMQYLGNPHPGEPAATREARAFVEDTRDWQAALDRFPPYLRHERSMLHALTEAPDNEFRAALAALPENLQRMFVHAAQSYLFNRMLSARMESDLPFDRAVKGDVICFADTSKTVPVPDPARSQRVTENRVTTVNRHLDRGRAFLTAPLVGTDTTLGTHRPGELERTVLDEFELAPDDFALPDPFGSRGTRRIIRLPLELAVTSDPLCFSFSLPKGSYATVVLREYLKVSPTELT